MRYLQLLLPKIRHYHIGHYEYLVIEVDTQIF